VALITGIETVFYQVCNMERSIVFYEGVLGLTLRRRETNDWAEFELPNGELALAGELAIPPKQGGATLVLQTSEIETLKSELRAAGGQVGDIEDMGGALSLEFTDPDGNRLVALQPVG
jgi:predicted enzyme related to lactoylglutathione lyase